MGLAYLPGSLPCFETFGNLPTDLVREDGLVEGKTASDVLDMIIIPGGSLVESNTLKEDLAREICKMADCSKFVLGICSGFQILSNGTDIGRLSAYPIMRKGLGLIDAEFTPLICTDQVKATVIGTSCLTDAVGSEVSGFHCHTYGNVVTHKKAKPILVSHTKRLNYHENAKDLVSGISNDEGNVVGVMIHGLLDRNPLIIEGIQKSLDISNEELRGIRAANGKLLHQIKAEIGISTNVYECEAVKKQSTHRALLVTALGSGSGKTFIVTGLAGTLKKKGFKVGAVKVGGDIRDVVPALYLIKEPIRDYSSIRVGQSGWMIGNESVKQAEKEYDFLIIEGAMNAFTGLLNEKVMRPSSTAEIAAALGVSTVVVVTCDMEGIEGALVNVLNYVNLLKNLGVKTEGVILNKVHTSYLTENVRRFIEQTLTNAGVELLGIVPRVDVEGRGAIPEIEIKYEEFGAKAIEVIENSLNIDKIIHIAEPTRITQLDYNALTEKFRNTLLGNISSEASKSGKTEKCS
ncbi:MAG: AAA family ATPase [Candidatus Bathyarchaeia archaeon]